MEDAAKKRRRYVVMAWLYRIMIGYLVITCGGLLMFSLWPVVRDRHITAGMLMPITGSAGLALMSLFCVWLLRDEARTKLPYVPPVAEQLAALPAEEVLVRASDEPTATPDELLRAASAGVETQADELLRPRQ
jgi:hypothetical protein